MLPLTAARARACWIALLLPLLSCCAGAGTASSATPTPDASSAAPPPAADHAMGELRATMLALDAFGGVAGNERKARKLQMRVFEWLQEVCFRPVAIGTTQPCTRRHPPLPPPPPRQGSASRAALAHPCPALLCCAGVFRTSLL